MFAMTTIFEQNSKRASSVRFRKYNLRQQSNEEILSLLTKRKFTIQHLFIWNFCRSTFKRGRQV